MDLKLLKAFCVVADLGSLTRAAAVLEETQSVLSRRMAALEAELGGQLFHRTGRGMVLTAFGTLFLRHARIVSRELDEFAREAMNASGMLTGEVELAAVPSISRPLISELINLLWERYPGIRLRPTEAYSGEIEQALANGRIDLGIFNRYSSAIVPGADIVDHSSMVLVSRRGATTDSSEAIRFATLRDTPLVLAPRPNAFTAHVHDIAVQQSFQLNVVLETSSGALIQDVVQRTGLSTLTSERVALRDFDSRTFRFRRVVEPELHQTVWMSATTQRPLTEAVRAVMRLIRQLRSTHGTDPSTTQ